jgi:hypothetical protein
MLSAVRQQPLVHLRLHLGRARDRAAAGSVFRRGLTGALAAAGRGECRAGRYAGPLLRQRLLDLGKVGVGRVEFGIGRAGNVLARRLGIFLRAEPE